MPGKIEGNEKISKTMWIDTITDVTSMRVYRNSKKQLLIHNPASHKETGVIKYLENNMPSVPLN